MTKADIEQIVSIAIDKQKKNNNTWQSWIKLIVTIIIVPVLSVYSTIQVNNWRLEKLEKQTEQKVDQVWYEQYIIAQQKLIERLESESKDRDEEIKKDIEEIKNYLNELTKEKYLFRSGKT